VSIIADFDTSLKMPVCSRYGTDLFQKYFRADGRTYNVCQRYYLIIGKQLKLLLYVEQICVIAVSLFQSDILNVYTCTCNSMLCKAHYHAYGLNVVINNLVLLWVICLVSEKNKGYIIRIRAIVGVMTKKSLAGYTVASTRPVKTRDKLQLDV